MFVIYYSDKGFFGMKRIGSMFKNINRAKKLIIITVGFAVLIIGMLMIVLPGPAILFIPAGLSILAAEFVWARHLLKKIRIILNSE